MPSPHPHMPNDNINVAQSTPVNRRPLQQAISLHNIPEAALGTGNKMASSTIASCKWQLDKGKAITLENMNFMLGMFRDSFPGGLSIQPAACLESLHLSNTPNTFILPILDIVDEGSWSLIHVFYGPGNKKHIPDPVKVQYYDPGRAPGRSQIIRKELASWVERTYGKQMGFRFLKARGPGNLDNPNMSGIYVIRAALDFAYRGLVTTNLSSWGGDPKSLLKAKLRQQEHRFLWNRKPLLFASPTSENSGGRQDSSSSISPTTAATTPSTSPVVSQSKRPYGGIALEIAKTATSGKLTAGNNHVNPKALSRPPNDQYKTTSSEAASSASTSTAICNIVAPQINDYADEPCSEPNSKRRRVEKDIPLSLNVTEKMAEITLVVQDLGLPAVDALQREREKLHAELAVKAKASKHMEEGMNICDEKYEQRKKEHRSFVKECETIKTKIKTTRDWLNGYLPKLPSLSSLDNPVGVTDKHIIQAFSTAIETTTMIPLQDDLTEKHGRKRKAGQILESAWQECEERQKDFDKAGGEEKLVEAKLREACKREELTAITESFVKKTRACNTAWETMEGGGNKDWYGAFCQRRAQI